MDNVLLSQSNELVIDPETSTVEISNPLLLVEQPLVSVLILTYNHEKFLAAAIDGVLSQQTDFPFEILIGEDQSKDGTKAVALRYFEKYPNLIRIITSKHNVGAMKNFARLLKSSRGPLLAFCEGDDYWTCPNKLAEQISFLQKNTGIDISFHACHFSFGDHGEPIGPYIAASHSKIFSRDDVIRGGGGFMPSASIVVRKEVVERIPSTILDTSPMGDYLIQVYGSIKGGAHYINRSMCVYRRGHSTSWNFSLNHIENLIAFETSANLAVREMATDLCYLKKHFGHLIFNYNFQQFMYFCYKNDRQRTDVYRAILLRNLDLFNTRQRLLLKLTAKRSLTLLIFVASRAQRRLAIALRKEKYLKYI